MKKMNMYMTRLKGFGEGKYFVINLSTELCQMFFCFFIKIYLMMCFFIFLFFIFYFFDFKLFSLMSYYMNYDFKFFFEFTRNCYIWLIIIILKFLFMFILNLYNYCLVSTLKWFGIFLYQSMNFCMNYYMFCKFFNLSFFEFFEYNVIFFFCIIINFFLIMWYLIMYKKKFNFKLLHFLNFPFIFLIIHLFLFFCFNEMYFYFLVKISKNLHKNYYELKMMSSYMDSWK